MTFEINVQQLAVELAKQLQGSGAVPKLLTIQQVAEALACCDKHVRSRIEAGELEAIDIGTAGTQHLRVTRASLEAYIQRRRVA